MLEYLDPEIIDAPWNPVIKLPKHPFRFLDVQVFDSPAETPDPKIRKPRKGCGCGS